MSFLFDFNELYEDNVLLEGGPAVELDFGTGFAPQPVLQAQNVNPFEGLQLVQLDQSFVDAMLGRGIPVGEGNASAFTGQPGVFASGAIPGLTAPTSSNFDFDFVVDNGGNEDLNDFIPLVIQVATAAMEYLGQFIIGAEGASIDVGITLLQQGPNILASAGAAALYLGEENEEGVTEIITGTQIELVTGEDPNGDDVDIFININTDFLTTPAAFFGTDPDRVVPNGALDYVSILTHEIMHGLGFFSFRDNSGQDVLFDLNGDGIGEAIESTYGLNVSFADLGDPFLSATYDSANVRDVYGDAVQLETTFDSGGSDVSHFALFNPDGSIADTALALMNPASNRSDVAEMGLLELAVLQDLFYTVVIPDGTDIVNEFDPLPFEPEIQTPDSVDFVNGSVGIGLELDQESLFFSVPGSVGVEISTVDGRSTTTRAMIPADQLGATVVLSEDVLRSIVETDVAAVNVRLFNPAQLDLENGTNEDTALLTFLADLDQGTAGNDTMIVNVPINSIYFAGSGNDIMGGNDGSDIFYGESGNDRIFGRAGDDGLYGGDGADYLGGASGNDRLEGGAQNDRLFGGSGNDVALAGTGEDLVDGGSGDDYVDGGQGDDVVRGGSDNDEVYGSEGNDSVDGGTGDDFVDGGDGNDTVLGGSGNDTMVGGAGDDEMDGQADDDIMFGDAGNDRMLGGSGSDLIFGGEDDDIIGGGDGDDTLVGETGDDLITGGRGDDLLDGGDGEDTLNGGSGNDTVFGGEGNDVVIGGGRNDTLFGDGGDDMLFGQTGNDTLDGGAGSDMLTGGRGADIFVTSRGNEADNILDFSDGEDMLDLSDFSDAEIQAALDGKMDTAFGTVLTFSDGTVLTIENVDSADITADDILNFDGDMGMVA